MVTEVNKLPQNGKQSRLDEARRPPTRVGPQKKAKGKASNFTSSGPEIQEQLVSTHTGSSPRTAAKEDHFGKYSSRGYTPRRNDHRSLSSITSYTAVPSPPQSRDELYSNLLHLIYVRKPTTRLPVLLDYHDLYPDLHSARTYNLLIRVALRYRAYGVVNRLLVLMREATIPKDLETYKLEVRYFVDRGYWKHAWTYVNKLIKNDQFPRDSDDRSQLPYKIWLELCRPPSSRLSRQRIYDKHGDTIRVCYGRVVEGPEILQTRRSLLMTYAPTSVPTLAKSSPYAIYCVVKLLIRTGSGDRAADLIKAYFKAMPRTITPRATSGCLDIIHLHMISSTAKNGLPKFYDMRKRLFALLKLHPLLQPNARTLYLLLGPVLRAKYCGSVAWNLLLSFRKNWGDTIEDMRVRRRIIQCALKQGRMDVVSWINTSQKADNKHYLFQEHASTGTDMNRIDAPLGFRPPLTGAFLRSGREARSWLRLRARIRRKKTLLRLKREKRALALPRLSQVA